VSSLTLKPRAGGSTPKPHSLTFFLELDGDALAAALTESTLSGLQRANASVALAIRDLSDARAQAIATLLDANIDVTAWLTLDADDGYWLTVDNVEIARIRYAAVRDWLASHSLSVKRFGLDIETPIADSHALMTQRHRAVMDLLRRRRSRAGVRRAQRDYRELLSEIRSDGHAVESYQFPLVLDERACGSTLLQRAFGFVDLATEREVLMLYSTLLPPPFGSLLIDAYGPEADAIAVGITGGGVPFVLETTQRTMSYEQLLSDLRQAARYTEKLYIFSLEGCLQAGYFDRLSRDLVARVHWGGSVKQRRGSALARSARRPLRLLLAVEQALERLLPTAD
jgi:hypothetical protein